MPNAKPGRGDTRRNLQLLLALRRILCADGELERTLQAVAMELAQSIADYCVVDVVASGGTIRRLVIAHADASRLEDLRASRSAFVASEDGRVARGLTRGAVAELVTHGRKQRAALDADEFEFLRSEPATSYIQAPVVARGEPYALLTCVTTKKKPFDEGALGLLEEVAGWCSLFAEKALLAEAESRATSRNAAGVRPPLRTAGRVRSSG